ncbi:MAG: hypothetical protein FWC97_08405 [Treponema sp.]|nr:hypothetical protein [Treponema sp.]
MKKIRKVLCLAVIMLLIFAAPVFAMPSLGDLQGVVENFSDRMAESAAFNSTMGLNWSDAYIGQFLGIPPRFGAGVTMGFTFLNVDGLGDLLNFFNIDSFGGNAGFPLLGYVAEGRIGGFILPFDVGVKIGVLPDHNIPFSNISIDEYLLVGADFRYSLLPTAVPLMRLSLGVGVNHLRGGLTVGARGAGQTLNFQGPSNANPLVLADWTLDVASPTLGLNWSTTNVEFKAQASMSLLIFTPYLGFGVSRAWSSAGYNLSTNVTVADDTGTSRDLDDVVTYLNALGLRNINANGFGQTRDVIDWNYRLFGGVSFNLPLIRFDLTGMYDIKSESLGVTFGVRFQI